MKVITPAAIHSIPFDPSLLVVQRAYIPDCITMQWPTVLSTLNPDCMNPLYGYSSQENIQGWFNNFQSMGHQALQWICTAHVQSTYLGPYLGWNWNAVSQDVMGVEYPNRYLVKGPSASMLLHLGNYPSMLMKDLMQNLVTASYILPSVYDPSDSDSSSDMSSVSIIYDEDFVMNETEQSKRFKTFIGRVKLKTENSPASGDLVLHAELSAYAKDYPNYDVFSRVPLMDNSYAEHGAGDLTPYTSASSPIDLHVFSILSLPDIGNN